MTERPILFQGAIVRAILDGTKTQTRRPLYVLTKNGSRACFDRRYTPPRGLPDFGKMWTLSQWLKAQPGDRLWVRESWMPDPPADGTWDYTSWAGCRDGQIAAVPERFRHPHFCNYAASWLHGPVKWTPSIHMPHWACRLELDVTADVRVERLQDISEADAKAEGIDRSPSLAKPGAFQWCDYRMPNDPCEWFNSPVRSYQTLWESINGPGSWDANPWVWVVEFQRSL